jgi:acetolactate synthase-1/2/3 large subunit
MNAAELLVQCLEAEGVSHVFGLPGEETIHLQDALARSRIRFVMTRHEQGAAFMADVHGRLTGRAGVCLATLGPGATNLLTGVADANMDHAPLVAIAGQAATTKFHKESHQVLDLPGIFRHVTKFSAAIIEPETVPEMVRKAFKVAETEKPGASFLELPENVARAAVEGLAPLRVQRPAIPHAPQAKVEQVARLIAEARRPMAIIGNGTIRQGASAAVLAALERLNLPAATTFMAKGAIPFSHRLALGAIGLQAKDPAAAGIDEADLVLCIGYDMVEYDPGRWNPKDDKRIVNIDSAPAEVDAHYILEAGLVGDIGDAMTRIAALVPPRQGRPVRGLIESLKQFVGGFGDDEFPLRPQQVVWSLREAMAPDDIAISDVGAHKLWMGRLFRAERPNTCIISNGLAAMGIALPGAIAAKLAYPDRGVVAVMGDGGFLMNSQEIETALRLRTPIVLLVLRDGKYGLIEWHLERHFGRSPEMGFGNPDLVAYAESFGARGVRVARAGDLVPTVKQALAAETVTVIDCPIDPAENMRLSQILGEPVGAS